MDAANKPLEYGEIRVVTATPIEGESGECRLVVKNHGERRDRETMHEFVWEYSRHGAEIKAFCSAWEPSHDAPITPEDLAVLGYVKQYLEQNGVGVDRTLSEGMYRPLEEKSTVRSRCGVRDCVGFFEQSTCRTMIPRFVYARPAA